MGIDPSIPTPDSLADLPSRLAPVIERSPLPMVEVEGRSHLVCFVNAAFCTLLGKRRDELMGQPFEKIICNGQKCVEILDQVYATGEGKIHVEPDEGTPAHWLYAMWPALDEKNQPERVVIQMTKATQFRQNAAALNEALLLGGLRQHELRESAEKLNTSLQAEVGERRRVETELHAAQAELQASADKLEQTVAERTAQLQASIGELEAFAYSMAHDLRAPVRAIHGFTDLVLEMPPDQVSPAARDLLQRVVAAAIRMDSLIQDVLLLSSVIRRPITRAPIDVDALVSALVLERPELAPARAEITIERPLLPVLAHEAMLSQCFTNLLGNAVKFVTAGVIPRVRVWTAVASGPPPSPGRPNNPTLRRWVRIWIEDQGIGVPPEARERIFEIFQRVHGAPYEGSGIGLAIVRKAVERMGGRVGMESNPPKGSRFWLELPRA